MENRYRYLPAAPFLRLYSLHSSGTELEQNSMWRKRLDRAQRKGRLTVKSADELAVRLLGMHPSEVWDEWWSIPDKRDR